MKLKRILPGVMVVLATALLAQAQFKDIGYEMGISGGVVQMSNESEGAKMSGAVEACVAYPLLDPLQAELGLGYRELRGTDYHGVVMPLDLRLRFSPYSVSKWIPYVYAGIGLLHFDASKWPETVEPGAKHLGWTAAAPMGAGVQYRLDEFLSLDVRGGYTLTFSDAINPVDDGSNDSYLNLLVGLRVSAGTGKKKMPKVEAPPPPKVEEVAPPAAPDTTGQAARERLAAMDADRARIVTVYFDYDRSDIRVDQRDRIATNAEIFRRWTDWQVNIEGNSDERGTNEYNLALGERRATAVKRALVAAGIEATRITTISYGEERPADPGHTDAAWSKNRRAEFKAK